MLSLYRKSKDARLEYCLDDWPPHHCPLKQISLDLDNKSGSCHLGGCDAKPWSRTYAYDSTIRRKPTNVMHSSDALWDQLAPQDMALDSVDPSSPAKSSSLYSTDSVDSTDSGGTTVSDIVELYTDLVDKLPYDEETSNVEILQPEAYRDTIAPLLRRQFSSQLTASTLPFVPASLFSDRPSRSPPQSTSRQAPTFQVFSQNLRDRKAELVSPLSDLSSDACSKMAMESVSESSPVLTPRTRPFSFRKSLDVADDIDLRLGDITPPSSDLSRTESIEISVEAQMVVHPGETLPSSLPTTATSTYLPPNAIDGEVQHRHQPENRIGLQHDPYPIVGSSQWPQGLPYARPEPDRYYRNASTKSDSLDSFVIYSGVSETVKAMIKEKLSRRREAKEQARIVSNATSRYPGTKAEQQEFKALSKQQHRSSLRDDVSHVLRRMSRTSPVVDHVTPSEPEQPRRREKPTAILLTPYQQHGAEIWYSDNKKKREQKRRKRKEARPVKEAETHPPKQQRQHPSAVPEFRHRRTSSSKSRKSLDPSSYPPKRNTLKAALEGARNSLMQSSADKRREKLKESITIIGPTQLTAANAMPSAGFRNGART